MNFYYLLYSLQKYTIILFKAQLIRLFLKKEDKPYQKPLTDNLVQNAIRELQKRTFAAIIFPPFLMFQ